MALNVNIIGRDSEGNLRALKVNSEGNLDFGQLETEIQAVKDNQGKLYGKYGEAWIPVKVDSEGRPIISSDVTVNAEGMVVDLGQIKQGPAGTEPWPVQLSGTIVQEVFSRAVRTGNIGATITSPSERVNKGCIVVCTIFGVTGTFQSDEGLRLRVLNQAGTKAYYTGDFTFQRQSTAGQQVVYMFPGASRGDMLNQPNRFSMFSGVVPYANHITLEISGSFDAGQGFDCHVEIIWL